MPLTLEIITPDHKAYSNEVDYVLLPTTEGDAGILPGHVPLLAMIHPGTIQVMRSGHKESLAVDKGFVRVLGDHVSVLTEAAIDVEAIDLSVVEDAQSRAEKALKEAEGQTEVDPAEIERLEAITRFSVAQRIAKQRKL